MAADIGTLQGQVAGPVIAEADQRYDEARAIWNGMIDKRPLALVRCTGTADVVAALRFANEHDLDIAVRGGGHNVAGNAVCDGGIVIDLSAMDAVLVDPAASRVRAQGGTLLSGFDRETQQFGLGTTMGAVSMTGIAGLTLGGGLGWLMRRHGLACDNLVAAQVVTASGEVVTTDADHDPDLLWALRGGGGNFGVVTTFEYRLHPVGPLVYGGLAGFPAARAAEVFAAYHELAATAPQLGLNFVFVTAPPMPFVPPEVQFTPIVGIGVCHAGDLDEGERLVAPIRSLGPVFDVLGPIPYTAQQQMLDPSAPAGRRSYWKSGYLAAASDAAVATLIEHAATKPSPFSLIEAMALGGAVADASAETSAFGNRDAEYLYNVISMWEDPAEDADQIAWTRRYFDAMETHGTGGVYVNYLSADEQPRVQAAYGEKRYRRLVEVKRRYDPDNRFHLNQNIDPNS